MVHSLAPLSFGTPLYDGAALMAGIVHGNDGILYGTPFYGGTGVTTGEVFRVALPVP